MTVIVMRGRRENRGGARGAVPLAQPVDPQQVPVVAAPVQPQPAPVVAAAALRRSGRVRRAPRRYGWEV